MGRTLSPRELQNGREEYAVEYSSVLLAKIAEGKRIPQSNNTISVKETLISKTASKSRVLANEKLFEKEFKKFAGKKAPTAKIFERCIGRTAKVESELSA